MAVREVSSAAVGRVGSAPGGQGVSRRAFLRAGGASLAGLVLGVDRSLAGPAGVPFEGGKLAGLVPFADEQAGPADLRQ